MKESENASFLQKITKMQEDRPGLRNESERKRERLKRERPY